MALKKAVGRGSAGQKYDLLTVLGSFALSQDRSLQRQTLRLICLITARYNWQRDELSIGQIDIARLWSCDPRTVKREMAAFRQREWLVELRPAARGRVAVHRLGIGQILNDTRDVWEKVGPDLVARLSDADGPPVPDNKIIPFPFTSIPVTRDGTLWSEVAVILQQEDPAIYQAWFAALSPRFDETALILQAPGNFQARYIDTHLRPRIERHLSRLAPGLRLVVC